MTVVDDRPDIATASRLRVESPIGPLVLSGTDEVVTGLALPAALGAVPASEQQADAPAAVLEAAHQLGEYFARKRRTFDVPLALGGTEFQRLVWSTLAEIPYGETISYAELARWVGRPQAYRAVGQANGANPIAIILPCHRVIAADGTIGGYGGGLATKRHLLGLESGG